MVEERAIYVPRHGLPESVRFVRFVNRSPDLQRSNGRPAREDPSDQVTTVELWPGNYYGDLDGKLIARQTVTDCAEFDLAEASAPRVEPERSLVVLLHNPPLRWEVEFNSIVATSSERTRSFRTVIDNFGTAQELVADAAHAPKDVLAATLTRAM